MTLRFEMTYQKVVRSRWQKFSAQSSKWVQLHILHTVITVIQFPAPVSALRTSEQDVWCWWPWLTGTDFR